MSEGSGSSSCATAFTASTKPGSNSGKLSAMVAGQFLFTKTCIQLWDCHYNEHQQQPHTVRTEQARRPTHMNMNRLSDALRKTLEKWYTTHQHLEIDVCRALEHPRPITNQ
jgi:hypothetical protein